LESKRCLLFKVIYDQLGLKYLMNVDKMIFFLPTAKLSPNCPKPERPHREGVRREAVESGLAAAKARLASQPSPKRQYIRKKPKPPKLEEVRPSTSSTSSSSAFQTGSSKTQPSVTSPTSKKPKKGMATTKQRLSKILKMKF